MEQQPVHAVNKSCKCLGYSTEFQHGDKIEKDSRKEYPNALG